MASRLSLLLNGLQFSDEAGAWKNAGFVTSTNYEPTTSSIRLGSVTIELTGTGDGKVAWGFDPPPERTLDGLALTATTAPRASPVPRSPGLESDVPGTVVHLNGITGIDHVVVATGDADRTTEAFERAGLELRRERATAMGDSPMLQRFFWAGDVIIELVAPAEPDGGTASIWGIACTSPDLDATLAWLGPDRCTPARDAVQAGRRIASLRTRSLGIGTRIAVMSPHPRA